MMDILELNSDSCICNNTYSDLWECRADGRYEALDVNRKNIGNLYDSYSFYKIRIPDLKYIFEVLRNEQDNRLLYIRIFKEKVDGDNKFIIGREYIIKNRKRPLTNIFVNIIDDINEQLKKNDESILNPLLINSIIESIFTHMWFSEYNK